MKELPLQFVTRLCALTTALAGVTGCEAPTSLQPLDPDIQLHRERSNPVVLSASGSGRVTATVVGAPLNDRSDPFSLHARRRADGTARGKVRIKNVYFAPKERQRGHVTCMALLGASGIVVIGADIENPTPQGLPPGLAEFFGMFVRDNGEGDHGGPPPDQLVYGFLAAPDFLTPEETCQFLADAEAANPGSVSGLIESVLFDIDRGNIEVEAGDDDDDDDNDG